MLFRIVPTILFYYFKVKIASILIKKGENDLIDLNGMEDKIINELFEKAESELRVDSKKEKNLTL